MFLRCPVLYEDYNSAESYGTNGYDYEALLSRPEWIDNTW